MNEQTRAIRWLQSQLSGLAAVYRGVAPEKVPTPFIVVNWQGGTKQGDVSGYRLLDSSLYQVQAVGPAKNFDAVEVLADAMDGAIQREDGTAGLTNDARIIFCDCQSAVLYDEEDETQIVWSHVGGIYRILVCENN